MGKSAYHHGDLRPALIEAAMRMVERGGASQVSLRAIAREAGVSHAAPYHHFADREALLAEVASRGFEALGEALRTGADSSREPDPLSRLQGAAVSYVGFALAYPETYRLMFSALLSERSRYAVLQTAADGAFGVLLALLQESPAASRSSQTNPVAVAAWSTVHGLASLLIEGLLSQKNESVAYEEVVRETTRVLGRGLRAYLLDSAVSDARSPDDPAG